MGLAIGRTERRAGDVFRAGLAIAIAVFATTVARPAEPSWPQWRGPTRDGRISDGAWPDSLAEDRLKELWRVPLGPGYSGPLVVGERVIVAETLDKEAESVRALDRKTGRELWSARWPGALSVPFFAKANGDWIRATPACDGRSVYVAGMRDVLVALDLETGREQWRCDFPQRFEAQLPAFGGVSSPLVDGEFVYVQAGEGVAKVDRRTGEVAWRVLRDGGGMFGSAFSSPVIAEIAGRRQLVVQTRQLLAGVDLGDGRVLWRQEVPAFRGMNILTPAVFGDRILTSSYGGGTFCFEVVRDGEGFDVRRPWKKTTQGYMSSPVLHEGHAYLHLRNQRLTCMDLATGTERWTTTPFGKYWSLAANGDRLLALDERGELLLFRADPARFDLLDRRTVGDVPAWAHLAVAGPHVLVRALDVVRCLEWK